MFEFTILLSAFGAVLGMLGLNHLPKPYHPIFNWDRFSKVTDDGFFAVIEAVDPKFDEAHCKILLERVGGMHVTVIQDD